jgi:small subunit ribosomal protein S8e
MSKPVENLEKRKPSGGRRKPHRGRRKYEKDGYPAETILGERLVVKKRVRGGDYKVVLRRDQYANVADPDGKKVVKAKILRVLSNPANRDYERRGVITKGAIIETEVGRAKVVSRPSQNGVINAVLVK